MHYTKSDRAFLTVNFLLLTLFLLIILYPLLYVVSSSFSGGVMLMGGLSLIPAQWTLEGYRAVWEYKYVWTGYLNSLVYTLVGTGIAMVVTVLCAYPLARRGFLGGRAMMALCLFTMYFGGGLIPTYLWIKQLGMLDSIWALVLPGSLSIYNMIVMRTYFATQIPEEMLEAAQIDGCGEWRFLTRIALPLSGPILAVVVLYYAVAQWNSYFHAMIYIQTREKLPLQNVLREILIVNMSAAMENAMDPASQALAEKRAEIMKYSLIIVASLPVMCLYPFVQKYFIKGVMIGAVKG